MRVADENKVVVPDFVADYIEKHYDGKEPSAWDKADLLRDWDNYISVSERNDVREWLKNADNFLKFVIAIATDNYIVEPQKYYWRKKKEHIFNFEKIYETYLNIDLSNNDVFISNVEESCSEYKTKFTEQEAHELLKDDFNKFEKLGCE